MENASKALLMAGSVLLALLIISALVFLANSISNVKQLEISTEDAEKLAEFNNMIRTYDKQWLYGTELISLSNLIEDYNKRQAEYKGYDPITFKVTINSSDYADNIYIKQGTYSLNGRDMNLGVQFKKLEQEIEAWKTRSGDSHKIKFNGRTLNESAQDISGMREIELKELAKEYGISDYTAFYNYLYEEDSSGNPKGPVRIYNNLTVEMENFKRQRLFEKVVFREDVAIGRIVEVEFRKN